MATWIFGYGSLMWKPGFPFSRREPALLRGYHRRYCTLSTRGRGTPEIPGMMLGLLPGGKCTGIAFQIEAGRENETFQYLKTREGEGRSNQRVLLPIEFLNGGPPGLSCAWTFLPMVSNENYRGVVPHETLVRNIVQGVGERGKAVDYLRALMAELMRLEAQEPALEKLWREVETLSRENGRA